MTDISPDDETKAHRGTREWRLVWRHRYAVILALIVALMVGTWVVQSAEQPVLWPAGALVGAFLVWWARRRWLRAREQGALAKVDLSEVDLMTGVEFEEHVAMLMRVNDYTAVTVVGGADDGGADVLGRAPDGREVVVQCKRWNHPVPPNDVRAFIGVLHSGYEGYAGIFVSSSGFTRAAAAQGEGHMVLVDRDALARWMSGVEVPEPLSGG
ncbi:restriction endonuclease [Nocardiopsis sp. JB363]|uniref:restriction endonuclease n=1 Tax=Nocardiopsis sp. JB363 TaxID=1434837 RepID=UPI00097B4E44|nr:restriction endonuclease [Nocardiopsis sp. JB363]SIO87092.1 putative membrane protein [Nocardiopsis sp. JB363]